MKGEDETDILEKDQKDTYDPFKKEDKHVFISRSNKFNKLN
jgi:hypothetical protein